ncbi:MAG: two-component system, sensor histidine kinase YesM [Clostridiales bacterium]|nr:two-component system, sensor histidine kinase YesM [Clostridiales bacterium]
MFTRRKKRDWNITSSLSFRLTALMFIALVPITALLIYINYQARSAYIAQLESARLNLMRGYIQRVDTSLGSAAAFTINMARYENTPMQVAYSDDETKVAYAKVAVNQMLSERTLAADLIDGFFFMADTAAGEHFQITAHYNSNRQDKQRLHDFLHDKRELSMFSGDSWKIIEIEGHDYLLFSSADNRGIVFGLYVNLKSMITRLQGDVSVGSDLYYVQVSDDEQVDNEISSYIAQKSEVAPLLLYEVIDQNEIQAGLPFLQKYSLWVALLLMFLVPSLFFLIHRLAAVPVMNLKRAMEEVRKGDLEHRINSVPQSSAEIAIVTETFNTMIEEIKNLKIGMYEEELANRSAQLRNLQLQIRPHFLINSLNMVYNELDDGGSSVARDIIRYTVDYFRYMVRVNEDLVPLEAELNHVKSYLYLQQIRYPNGVSFTFEIDPDILPIQVPPLCVQTFIENSFKYAMSDLHELNLHVKVKIDSEDSTGFLHITISDDGPGFGTETLTKLRAGQRVIRQDGEHIGIYNIKRRIELIYGDRGQLLFNDAEGAYVEIIIPVDLSFVTRRIS